MMLSDNFPKHFRLLCLALGFAAATFADLAPADEPQPAATTPVRFTEEVRPILVRHCFKCHGPDEADRQGELRLDVADDAFAAKAFVPGKPDESLVLQRVASTDPDERMPPADAGPPLAAAEVEILRRWVAEGAHWQSHWSFEKPVRPALPAVTQTAWPRNPIDQFVLARLEQQQWQPSAQADPYTLVRRLALDLTGLPPDRELVESFVHDPSDQNYERLVDQLLASPAYGERWSRVWLDLARYADTRGYEKDRSRTMWRYRDWVIDAFNRDLPYDQFTREQLAGDLLQQPSDDQLLATAFHRNTLVNEEGGTDDEEFRTYAVKDRVDTTMQVWMGLTMGCAKCHTHKYDPISHRDYYQFYAIFNQTADTDRGDEFPTIPTPTARQRDQMFAQEQQIETLNAQLRASSPELEAAASAWEKTLPPQPLWSMARPAKYEAASGANLKLLGDGSLLASGEGPASETYRITLPIATNRLGGLRLEVLPHKSLPKGGVGRSKDDGNFVLSGLKLELQTADGSTRSLEVASAAADFAQENYPVEHALRNADPKKHGWAVSPKQTEPHTAVFALPEAIDVPTDSQLLVTIEHQFEYAYPGFSIGRFRAALTGDARPALQSSIPESVAAILRTAPGDRSEAQRQDLLAHYLVEVAPEKQELREKLTRARASLAAIQPVATPVMRELDPDKRRATKIHVRGNFLELGNAVDPAVPAAFHRLPPHAAPNRLGVADWLMSPENPLTARVTVNRHWAQFFGNGLVETQEDFGAQGQLPSHPELLDWLACELMQAEPPADGSSARRWSLKHLCRLIVQSATYRQSSHVSSELAERDRFNQWLARGPRFRLEAELVRDNALSAAGLLSRKMSGPSVMPYQPAGIWRSTYNLDQWVTSAGEDKHRRSVYTFIKRTSPYPAMVTLDGPSREICTIRRMNTNTPLQALVTLNDAVYVEAAQALARRMKTEGGSTLDQQLAFGLEAALIRPAKPAEVELLKELYRRRCEEFQTDQDAAVAFATEPLGALPDGWDAAELAALTAAANVILNLDECLTRG